MSTRGIYSTDKLRNWVSAYDLNHTGMVGARRGVVEVLCRTRMAGRRICLDRLRLSRRAYALWLAVDQLAIRHRGHVRISQRQFLLLQIMVGVEPVLHLFPHWNWDQRKANPSPSGCIPIWIRWNFS